MRCTFRRQNTISIYWSHAICSNNSSIKSTQTSTNNHFPTRDDLPFWFLQNKHPILQINGKNPVCIDRSRRAIQILLAMINAFVESRFLPFVTARLVVADQGLLIKPQRLEQLLTSGHLSSGDQILRELLEYWTEMYFDVKRSRALGAAHIHSNINYLGSAYTVFALRPTEGGGWGLMLTGRVLEISRPIKTTPNIKFSYCGTVFCVIVDWLN